MVHYRVYSVVSTSGVHSVKNDSRFVITRGQKAVRYGELYVHPFHTQSEVESERLKVKRYSSSRETHLRATGHHLSCGITQCYLPTDTGERAAPNPSQKGWHSIYLPRRDERLS